MQWGDAVAVFPDPRSLKTSGAAFLTSVSYFCIVSFGKRDPCRSSHSSNTYRGSTEPQMRGEGSETFAAARSKKGSQKRATV